MYLEIRNKNQLTITHLKECITYNADTGEFLWLYRPRHHFNSDRGWRVANTTYANTTPTCRDDGYLIIRIGGYGFSAHQLAYFWMTDGQWPPAGKVLDHINRIRDDNSWDNLRLVTPSENSRNQGISPRNTSGVTGVSWDKANRSWRAHGAYWNNGKKQQTNLGRHKDKFEAICARKSWEVRAGGFTSNHGT